MTRAELAERIVELEAERDELRRMLAETDHPVRGLIRGWLAGRPNGSPVQFASEHGLSLGAVSYHFRVLERRKIIQLARTRQVRGAREHFYRLRAR